MDIHLSPAVIFLILFLVPVAMMFRSAYALRKLQSPQREEKTSTVSIAFENDNDQPICLQVEPWVGFYLLKKGDRIEFVSEAGSTPRFEVVESEITRRFTILDSTEYFVVVDGQRIHWEKYYLDRRLCPKCLKLLTSEEPSDELCRCTEGAT